MRRKMAEGMDAMANAVLNKTDFTVVDCSSLVDPSLLTNPFYGEFARNSVDRYQELELAVSHLKTLA
jgi:multidrug resistance protein MdtO